MSAEIIQLGKVTTAPQRRAYKQTRVAKRHDEKSTVRFTFEGDLYEAEFCGADLLHIFRIDYRISASGVEE